MKTTTSGFKTIMASANARKYKINISLTLADDEYNPTVLQLDETNIWEDSFSIETASSGTSSFDIGCAVIGKCTFTINNILGSFDSYDFFNASATVWLGLEGDVVSNVQQYCRMGIYTVDEPQKANGLISLTLLDNMWKFDVPLSEAGITFTSSTTARSIVLAMCSHCGVTLSTQQFSGYDIPITEEPKNADNMNCREMLQYIAMLGCNFCVINDDGSLSLKWYDTSATSARTDVFDYNQSTSFGTEDITITGVKFTIDKESYQRGSDGYVLELENPLVNEDNVYDIIDDYIWVSGRLYNFTLRTYNITTASDLAAEIGDKCKIKDYKGNYVYSWITTNSFKTAGHQIQCNAVSPQRTLTTRYSKTVSAAVEQARRMVVDEISNYDLSVQELNNLANQAMGAYSDYEDIPTGGRYYYISNMPITKNAQGQCVFETGSIVFRMAGDLFTVSTDGGQTWQNGYNPQTGKLVVNVLSTIGLDAEWIKTGTLTVGGSTSGTQHPNIQVYDSNNQLICEINRNGITMHQGIISSPDYAEVSGETYSTTGMKIDVLNDVLRSPYFAIDPNGAYFRGEIAIKGDIEVGRNSFRLRPTDYYLATDFRIEFQAAEGFEGTSSVSVVKHYFTMVQGQWVEDTYTAWTGTLVDDESETTGLLDHTCGQNGKDYYQITVTSSSTVTATIKDAELAYVGEEGFRGRLEGIFKGYMETDSGILAGFRYGQGTGGTYAGENGGFVSDDGYDFSMTDGFGRPNGSLLKLYDNAFNFGNAGGHFRFFKSDSQGGGSDSNSIGIQTGTGDVHIYKYDSNGTIAGEVPFDDGSYYTNSRVTASTTDITAGTTQLANGNLYLVYE